MTFVNDLIERNEVDNIVFTQIKDESRFKFDKCTVIESRVGFKRLMYHLEASWRFINAMLPDTVNKVEKILAKEEIKTIVAHFGPQACYAIRIKERNPSIKFISIFHGFDVYQLRNYYFYRKRLMKVFEYSDIIIAISKDIKNVLVSLGCDEKKIEVLYIGVEKQKINQRTKCGNLSRYKEKTFIHYSGYTEKKGIDTIIEALRILDKKKIYAKFIFAGEGGGKEKIENLRNELRYIKIDIRGYLNKECRNILLEGAYMMLHPSETAKNGDKEGMPVAIKESMMFGVPVISTFHSAIPEIVSEENGFLVEEKNSQALAKAINNAINLDLEEYRLKSIRSRRIARSFHEKEKYIIKYLDLVS